MPSFQDSARPMESPKPPKTVGNRNPKLRFTDVLILGRMVSYSFPRPSSIAMHIPKKCRPVFRERHAFQDGHRLQPHWVRLEYYNQIHRH